MIKKISIRNYKSINDLEINPGRLNIIIGENGCGKSNFLEAVSLAGAASKQKLDNEFLANRGIRVTSPQLMRSNFPDSAETSPIEIDIINNEDPIVTFKITNDNKPYSSWKAETHDSQLEKLRDEFKSAFTQELLKSFIDKMQGNATDKISAKTELDKEELRSKFQKAAEDVFKNIKINDVSLKTQPFNLKINMGKSTDYPFSNFMIYSPENSSLRKFHEEGQVEPLGVNGEGLLKLIQVIRDTDTGAYHDIIESLKLFSWFKGFEIPDEYSKNKDNLKIDDKFTRMNIDQRSANEGFLFVLFYVSLIVSSDTPAVFAIDNIDTSLNPKLCSALIIKLNHLSAKYNKQLFVTTHNPAVLDGLDLNDDMQRLFVFKRNRFGHTKVNRITAEKRPKSASTQDYLNLSESMLRGYLKSLPTNF